MSAAKSLVIVESPAKAKTIAGFLGSKYIVESSIGHVRDLPRNAGAVPAAYKKTSWGRLGVDVDNDFKPLYVVDADKKDHIKRLQALVKDASELYLATDEDREGESIAWHLLEVLKPKIPVRRMAFHEITKKAIQQAIQNPREIDRRLVDAQEARRILDRLYGYEVSPVLWKKVMPKLSAGRVQSVATRIVVNREAERMAFVPAGYWDITGQFSTEQGDFEAALSTVDGERVASGKDFDARGQLEREGVRRLSEAQAKELALALQGVPFVVTGLEEKPNRRSPAPPFMTSTLQQEAGRKLRMSSSRAMRAAQTLYERGFITYMRTDSTTLSEAAITASRTLIAKQYGPDYLPAKPRLYKNKVKNAQEAHEAIRPAGDEFQMPAAVAQQVGADEARLYELIWKRTVACQMEDARGQSVKLTVSAKALGQDVDFSVTGNTITFPGFLRAYVEGSDDPEAELEGREKHLPAVVKGQSVQAKTLEALSHETQPPARFTEASLVKRLEELGVGRPSTYASIISTIINRGYVWKKGTALVPSFKAFAVNRLLEKHFGALVDYSFTAKMEDELDAIAAGSEEATPWLRRFYFGSEQQSESHNGLSGGLRSLVAERLEEIDARAINSLHLGVDPQGDDIVVRVGRYGPYLQRGEDTANVPEDLPPDELTVPKAVELLAQPSGDRLLGTDPDSGLPVYARSGRFGSYVQLGEAGGKEKPRTGSLLKSMSIDTVTLDEAVQMLSLPRLIGQHPESGDPITAQLGRFGPYITHGTDSRSLESEQEVFSTTLEQALALLKQPKQRGQRAAKPPLKELGPDAVSGKPIVVKEGRFGPYVTDGEVNASLRKDDDIETLTQARAEELLQARRERAPVRKKTTKKKAAKKATAQKVAKKATAKKVAKKAAAKKATAKKVTKKATAKKAAKKKATKKSPPTSGEP